MNNPHAQLEQAAALLRRAHYAVALTGAGVSTSSGIPDFRSPHSGLWETADPHIVASMFGFRSDPRRFFEWVRPVTEIILDAQPNGAHHALADLEALGVIKALITQNIDVLHSRAGSKTVYEVHGHLRTATCVECFREYEAEALIRAFIANREIPRCTHCGGIVKPNVVLFGEALPYKVIDSSRRAAQACDVMLIAGSSLEVAPAADLPVIALAHGAKLIMINYEATYIDSDAEVVIHDDVARTLPALARMIAQKRD